MKKATRGMRMSSIIDNFLVAFGVTLFTVGAFLLINHILSKLRRGK